MDIRTMEQQITQAVLKRNAALKMGDCPLKDALLLEARLSIQAAKNDRLWDISQQYRADLRHDPILAVFLRALRLSQM